MNIGPEEFTAGMNAATSAMNLASKWADVRKTTTFSWLDGAREKAKRAETTDESRQAYEEIISNLTQANAEYENIARGYKELYEQMVISEKDMKFLHETLQKAILLMYIESPNDTPEQKEEKQNSVESAISILNFINSDTLRTMQLLGFNYKEAIGKPLTQICAQFIESKFTPQQANRASRRK